MGQALFFEASQGVTERLGELFNFVWSNTVAMWTLREQVEKFIAEVGNPTEKELADRFVKASGVSSADLRTTCTKWTWETQKEQFAKILLFELCGLYESWLEDVVAHAMPAGTSDEVLSRLRKGLQFPSSMDKNNHSRGFAQAIAQINNHRSPMMVQDFFPVLKANRKNSWREMETMLKAYRYFKECRNKLIHTGGIVTPDLMNAYNELALVDPKDLCLKGPLQLPVLELGKRISIALPDIVALSNIIHRVIITLDAALAVTQGSEEVLLERIRKILSKGKNISKTDVVRRERGIRSLVRKANLPEPKSIILLESVFVQRFSV
jgi:hypothetical protein